MPARQPPVSDEYAGQGSHGFDAINHKKTGKEMKAPLTGGCMCGAIRYECGAEPTFMANCHCRDCQRALSSAYFPSVVVPLSAFSVIKGRPKYYVVQSDGGNTISRGFCAECGSFVVGNNSRYSDHVFFSAANLDDPSSFRPTMDFFVESAQPWDHMNPSLPKIPRMPSF